MSCRTSSGRRELCLNWSAVSGLVFGFYSRRHVKNPVYASPPTCARCLLWCFDCTSDKILSKVEGSRSRRCIYWFFNPSSIMDGHLSRWILWGFFLRLTLYTSNETRTLLRCDSTDCDLLDTCASRCGYWNKGMRCFGVAEARLKHVTPP